MLRHLARALLLLPAAVALALVAGFGWFMHLANQAPPPPPAADGIVALTGGAERVATALHLLGEGHAPILLISGAGAGTDYRALARLAGVDPGLGSRVTLGHDAASTHGNAMETARWARAHDLRSLMVVTAFYHMPRAMAELTAALPGTALFPVPVHPRLERGQELRLLVSEYSKWLAVRLGLAGAVGHEALAGATPDRAGAGGG